MEKKINIMATGLIILLTACLLLALYQLQRKNDQILQDTAVSEMEIARLRVQLAQLYAELDSSNYTPKEVIRERIKKIYIQSDEEIKKYYEMDTTGRVEHFRQWVRDSAN